MKSDSWVSSGSSLGEMRQEEVKGSKDAGVLVKQGRNSAGSVPKRLLLLTCSLILNNLLAFLSFSEIISKTIGYLFIRQRLRFFPSSLPVFLDISTVFNIRGEENELNPQRIGLISG